MVVLGILRRRAVDVTRHVALPLRGGGRVLREGTTRQVLDVRETRRAGGFETQTPSRKNRDEETERRAHETTETTETTTPTSKNEEKRP